MSRPNALTCPVTPATKEPAIFNDSYQKGDAYTFTFRHADWPKGWVWVLSRIRTGEAVDLQNKLLADHGSGTPADDSRALLLSLSDHWTIRLPKDFKQPVTDAEGNIVMGKDGRPETQPHPLAGKVPPLSWEYVCKLDIAILGEALTQLFEKMNESFRGEVADTADFQTSDPSSPPAILAS